MNSKRFKERFKDKASYVTRNGRLTITPENFISKFPLFSTKCHSYDDYLSNSSSSLKKMTPTPVSDKLIQHYINSPDIFCEESQHKMHKIKPTGYKQSGHHVFKKTSSFIDKSEKNLQTHSKDIFEVKRKKQSQKAEIRGHNTSYCGKRVLAPSPVCLEKKKTFSGRTFARLESGFQMTPTELYIREWTYK